MGEDAKPSAPGTSVPFSAKTIGLLVVAVVLAEGIWGVIVSLTRNLIVPFLVQQMGADAQSPLYLGKGVYDFAALFVSVLELCFAGFVAVVLSFWVNRRPKAPRVKTVIVRKAAVQASGSLSIAPTTNPPATQETVPTITPPVQQAPAVSVPQPVATVKPAAAPKPAPPVPPAKPAKPEPPKEVYYNIVGEPINPTEDE